jgi:hypothetical protein
VEDVDYVIANLEALASAGDNPVALAKNFLEPRQGNNENFHSRKIYF